MICFIHIIFSLIRSTQEHLNPQMTSSHLWFHSSVSLRALHHHCEVTCSNLIEALNFSGFSMQLLKIVFKTARIIALLDIISYHRSLQKSNLTPLFSFLCSFRPKDRPSLIGNVFFLNSIRTGNLHCSSFSI